MLKVRDFALISDKAIEVVMSFLPIIVAVLGALILMYTSELIEYRRATFIEKHYGNKEDSDD